MVSGSYIYIYIYIYIILYWWGQVEVGTSKPPINTVGWWLEIQAMGLNVQQPRYIMLYYIYCSHNVAVCKVVDQYMTATGIFELIGLRKYSNR